MHLLWGAVGLFGIALAQLGVWHDEWFDEWRQITKARVVALGLAIWAAAVFFF